MMKYFNVFVVFLIAFLSSGCLEESSNILYEEGEPEIVIEGRITDVQPPYYIRVSESVNPQDEENSSPIGFAKVILSDDNGNSNSLDYAGDGLYVANNIQGEIGQEYHLVVSVGDDNYYASDSIKQIPRIDSVRSEYLDDEDREEGYYLVFYIQNKTRGSNFYKIELTVNDSAYNGYYDLLYVADILGQISQTSILPYQFNRYDTVVTVVHSITETMYEYYRGLNKQVDNLYGNVQPPLLNPPNNIEGALGYFQASSLWQDTTVIE